MFKLHYLLTYFFIYLALTACGGGGGGGSPAVQTESDPIPVYFYADKDTDEKVELYKIISDGSGLTKLSGNLITDGDVVQMRLSPNERYLAYLADAEVDDKFELYVVDLETNITTKVSGTLPNTSSVKLENDYDDPFFAWSPDSLKLAFFIGNVADDNYDLIVVDFDGSNLTNITFPLIQNEVEVRFVEWGADSENIAFIIGRDSSDFPYTLDIESKLFSYNLNADNLISLTSNDLISASGLGLGLGVDSFAWSPDGKKIAYVGDLVSDDKYELFVISPDGSNLVTLSGIMGTDADIAVDDALGSIIFNNNLREYPLFEQYNYTEFQEIGLRPSIPVSWSPDSSQLVFTGDLTTNDKIDLYKVDVDGSNLSNLTTGLNSAASDVGFATRTKDAWSPNGTKVQFVSDDGQSGKPDLYVVDANGANINKITNLPFTTDQINSEWQDNANLIITPDEAGNQPLAILANIQTNEQVTIQKTPTSPSFVQYTLFPFFVDNNAYLFERGEGASSNEYVFLHEYNQDSQSSNLLLTIKNEGAFSYPGDEKGFFIYSEDDGDDGDYDLISFDIRSQTKTILVDDFVQGGSMFPGDLNIDPYNSIVTRAR